MHLVWFAHYQGNVPHEEPLKGSFWWKDVLKHVDNFRGVAAVVQGRGDTSLFWKYNWTINGSSRTMSSRYPRLLSFVLNDSLSVAQVYSFQDSAALFHRSLSTQAFQEFEDMSHVLYRQIQSRSKMMSGGIVGVSRMLQENSTSIFMLISKFQRWSCGSGSRVAR
jgi:hypothetical protein